MYPELALVLIHLTGPDKQQIEINPESVVALRAPRGKESEHFAPGIKCVVYTSDTHFIAVMETCDQVREKLTEVPLPRPRPPDLK